MDRQANRYNILGFSEAICPKWATVVGNKLETRNMMKNLNSFYCWLITKYTLQNLTVRSNNMVWDGQCFKDFQKGYKKMCYYTVCM